MNMFKSQERNFFEIFNMQHACFDILLNMNKKVKQMLRRNWIFDAVVNKTGAFWIKCIEVEGIPNYTATAMH